MADKQDGMKSEEDWAEVDRKDDESVDIGNAARKKTKKVREEKPKKIDDKEMKACYNEMARGLSEIFAMTYESLSGHEMDRIEYLCKKYVSEYQRYKKKRIVL